LSHHIKQASECWKEIHSLHRQFQNPDTPQADKAAINRQCHAFYREAALHQLQAMFCILENHFDSLNTSDDKSGQV
jgi:hypothetical protein